MTVTISVSNSKLWFFKFFYGCVKYFIDRNTVERLSTSAKCQNLLFRSLILLIRILFGLLN